MVYELYVFFQAILEFLPQGKKHIYGKEYDLFRHGGLVFWFTSSMFFALVSSDS